MTVSAKTGALPTNGRHRENSYSSEMTIPQKTGNEIIISSSKNLHARYNSIDIDTMVEPDRHSRAHKRSLDIQMNDFDNLSQD